MKTDLPVPPQTKPHNSAAKPPPQHAAAVAFTRAPVNPATISQGVSNTRLLLWMFRFLKPVKPLVFLACLYLSLWVGAEVMAVRQSGQAVNVIGAPESDKSCETKRRWTALSGLPA